MLRRCLLMFMFMLVSGTVMAQEPVATPGSAGATATPAPLPDGIPNPAGYKWTLVADGFDSPLGVYAPNDGTGRLFVLEQSGKIWIIKNGEVELDPFLDIGPLLPVSVFQGGYTEQGLLGLAFHPQFKDNGVFFLDYVGADGNTAIARYQVSSNPDLADPNSARVILTVNQPYPDHNGGEIAFGPDGYLYIGMGDGGNPDDPLRNGQNMDTLLAKLLRIDINGTPYKVPADNPFVNDSSARPEIWATGLRNPWRFSFDKQTGDLYIGDVGQWAYEEVDFQPAGQGGQNYGWSAYQGMHPHIQQTIPVDEKNLTLPVLEYPHTEGCSITGGYVYRGTALPAMNGIYMYGDYCNGRVWLASRKADGTWQSYLWMQTNYVVSSFGQDESGEVYLVDYKGAIYKLTAAG